MKYLTVILVTIILLTGCKTFASSPSSSETKKQVCHEFKDGDLIVAPVSETRVYVGVIVISDRNIDPCERIYLMLLRDNFNRPFFIHWYDVLPLVKR